MSEAQIERYGTDTLIIKAPDQDRVWWIDAGPNFQGGTDIAISTWTTSQWEEIKPALAEHLAARCCL